jgi:hypothetical protein
MQTPRRSGERTRLGNGKKIAELTQIHDLL